LALKSQASGGAGFILTGFRVIFWRVGTYPTHFWMAWTASIQFTHVVERVPPIRLDLRHCFSIFRRDLNTNFSP